MLIDWFTVGAQALNFLILVWLMKRFLYQPILDAIDAREKRIAANLADAAAKEAEAKKERDEFQHKNDEFDQQRASLLNEATQAAKTEGQRLLDAARAAADEFSTRRRESVISDARNLRETLSRQTQDEVFAIARKTLTDLASERLEAHMVDTFIHRLRTMPDETRTAFAGALNSTSEPALVRSAFDLPAAQHKTIQEAINEIFSVDIQPCFQTMPNVISGIELSANGRKLAWSIADYLAAMERNIDEVLLEPSNLKANPEAGPGSTTAAVAREETE
jgi:F-type H+-transporting ATPase subunit b